ncbi:cadherin-like beta sandwich domain-containing protein [Cohnella faecalis]|uniref:Fibronectin type-III domain-containing protein n=1 Tax=Cohnella faecalis TaxID=2315694 RepID=A0A398CCV9_9BACL|nr:S-layer homology domain-containing protein [Cohnella faecalis]RIE00255.1 hypothetical protein D3H35_29945 [Cohnella faecalis]
MRNHWISGLAKLLIAALLLQSIPLVYGSGNAAHAEGAEQVSDDLTDYTWKRADSGTFKPAARQAASMAYDEAAGNVVLFGGESSVLLNDTWLWDGSEQTWQEAAVSSTKPVARKYAVTAFDPVSQKVLLFGGEGSAGVLNDTWLWNGQTASWEKLTPAISPSQRAGAQLAYDGEHLILFGGYKISGGTKTSLGDTWLWDGTNWTDVTPTDPGASPPAAYNGQMTFDGQSAVLYGGITGNVTVNNGTTDVTMKDSSPKLWHWNADTLAWSSTDGPESFGRWGHTMAYDGRRVVFFSGARDYLHSFNGTLITDLKMPSSVYPYPRTGLAYGLKGGVWEGYPQVGSSGTGFQDDVGYPGQLQLYPNQRPFPLTNASMAFDGTNFVIFGGHRDAVDVWDKHQIQGGHKLETIPAGVMNETWVFGYTPPSPPGIKMVSEPIINLDPAHLDDTVSVVTSVYSLGGKPVTSRGVEYRPYTEAGSADWIAMPYSADPQATGSFTVTLTGLTWQQEYEVRSYAVNEIGTSYTPVERFVLEDDPSMEEPDVRFDRIGPSVLHVKDKKRIVAVGEGVTNLLRKPLNQIHYYLKNGGSITPLNYNILSKNQLELTWEADLPPGSYEVHLEHDTYQDYVYVDDLGTEEWNEGLALINVDFYKPRNFDRIDVPSTASGNEQTSLWLQGPFTETPSKPKEYVLNDTSEVVTINGNVLFKGSRLVVDKTDSAKTVITGEGRLYVNSGSSQGASLPYTLHDGPFAFDSDDFSLILSGNSAADYMGIDMPFKANKLTFAKDGLNLSGNLEVGFTAGSQKISSSIPISGVQYRNSRFELSGTYAMNKSFKVGPLDVSNTQFVIDSRVPYISVKGTGKLPNDSLGFDLLMKVKQGRLDEIGFGMYSKTKLASTGLQVNYLFGNVNNLAGKTQIPQRLGVTGSVADIIVPELKHPSVSYKFNLLGTDSIAVDLTNYGFDATGIEYYYWLPVNNMSMQTVVNPTVAGIPGFTSPGFLAKGDINVFDTIKGVIAAYSFNKKGYSGVLKGTVYVPKGIPRIGGVTVRNVVLSVNEKGVSGLFKHNGINARVTYTFQNNTILFEVEAEPPKKSWWEKGLDLYNSVNDFFEKTEPLGDLLEEIFLFNPNTSSSFNIAAADDWMKYFDFTQFNVANNVASTTGELKKVYELTPVRLAFQPEDTTETEVSARIADGQLTAVDRTPLVTTKADAAANGQISSVFPVKRAYEALIAINGDQRSAVLKASSAEKPTVEKTVLTEVVYDADRDTTYMRASLYAGSWKLITGESVRISVNELVFAKKSLTLEQLAGVWAQTADRSVTSLNIEEAGVYALNIDAGSDEVVLYKPDGRPYDLQGSQNQAGWNSFLDADDNRHVLLNAIEPGTWLIIADESPKAAINRVPAKTTTDELKQWVQDRAYPTFFEMSRTTNGQAIVEIYGADEETKLYMPSGELYSLQPDPNLSGLNVAYDESQNKLTVWLDKVELKGQWKVVSGGFTSFAAYKTSRKFKSIKPLLDEGRYSKYFELAEKGDYMLSVSGGNTDTVIYAPNGKPYTLSFEDQSGNAYLQPAADRTSSPSAGGDPLNQTQIVTPNPVQDGRDMLYVSLLNAPAGKWRVQNGTKVDLQIQKLIPSPDVKASADSIAGANNRIRVTWSTENAAADTEVAIMLTGSKDAYVGEVLAEGLAAAGSTVIDIPEMMIPGTYYVTVAATSVDKAPTYAIVEEPVVVSAPYSLNAPAQLSVQSTGNGEVSLKFSSVSGQVERYRVWVGEGADVQPATPVLDFAPEPGASQQAVISGLRVNEDYTIAVSAIGEQEGRLVLSPLSDNVSLTLPAPQPAALTVSVDAGSNLVANRTYKSYDGSDIQLALTAADQAKLDVTTNQAADLTFTINGHTFDSVHVAANGSYSFDLNERLETSVLEEQEYKVTIEAVNARGDRSVEYRRLFVDRTAPLLIASGGDDATGAPISLNGTIDTSGKVLIVGQTEVGAKLDINGVIVPLDDAGRFVYYAPLAWDSSIDRILITIKASDEAGNTTAYGFEVLKAVAGADLTYPGDLAALTTVGATMSAPYQFGTVDYETVAYLNKVRVYAAPMVSSSVVSIEGTPLPTSGYVEVAVPDAGRAVQIRVKPAGGLSEQLYTLNIETGSSAALLSTLTLKTQSGEAVAAQPFTGTEETYNVYVDNSVDGVTLTPDALMAGSVIRVKGQDVQNGQPSQTIPLQVDDNPIPVTVVSPDGLTTRSYQVVVSRMPSGNSELQQLGIATAGVSLTPGFDPNVLQYQVLVPHDTTAFALQPVAQQADAAVLVNGQESNGSTVTIPFGGESLSVAIEIRAPDDSERKYTLSVVRQKGAPAQAPLLTSLSASTALDGEFNPYQFFYGTKGQTENYLTTITAVAGDPQAIVTVKGVSLQGGGKFMPSLSLGENTIVVRVESADLTASRTYSINIKRVSKPEENLRHSTITGSAGDWSDQIEIVRTRTQEGTAVDTVRLDAEKARHILDKAKQNKDSIARIYVTDIPDDPADERMVKLSADSLSLLADGGMSLQIVLPEAVIDLPAASLQQLGKEGQDAYFRIIPVIADDERGEVTSRVLASDLVQQAAGGQPASVIGHPVKIETNYSGFKTKLLFPLTDLRLPADKAAAKQLLSELAVYIEHSDGEKVLAPGEIRYDAEGNVTGIAIEINKFSTFAIVRTNAANTVLEPYMSGYPDGTFRPSQSIKRAELAAILHRLGAEGTLSAQAAGYADVAAKHWAAEAIAYMKRSGLMLGDNKGLFRPEDAVTRAEMASIVARLLPASAANQASAGAYSDTHGHWAADAIKKAAQASILQGYPDGTFRPDNKLTRAEAVQILNKLFQRPTAGVPSSSWLDVPLSHWAIREIESASGTVEVSSDGTVLVEPAIH